MREKLASAVLCAVVAVSFGCGGSPYYLPPPKEDQGSVAVNPAEQAEQQRQQYLAARAALLKLYETLSKDQFEAAEQYLSQQTRDFLAFGSEAGDASAALASGQLVLPNGQTVAIDPVDFLIGGKVSRIVDTREGAEEHETRRRKELFVIDPDGQAHRVIMILEGDQWVLQKTSIGPQQD